MLATFTNLLSDMPVLAAGTSELNAGGILSLLVVALIFVLLQVRRNTPVELLFIGGLVAVTLSGVISPADALAGFASPPVLLIGALFAAAAGLRTTGALDWLGGLLLGSAKTERSALLRLTLVAPVSAVVLNTPMVAMLAPVVIDWCRKNKVSPSRLLIPLSYLTILGGVITVIGTSTTLVCNAKLTDAAHIESYSELFRSQLSEIGLLEITWVGLPVALLGIVYLLTIAPKLLPNRTDLLSDFGDRRREYLVEMLVQPNCGLIGQTVEKAGLRQLPGLFLIEISRGDEIITPVTPSDVIVSHDRMVFSGVVETIVDLERIPGLVPAVDMTYESKPSEKSSRQLAEAVLSSSSPLIGRTVREANFRQRYNAAIVAVHRGGERLETKIGNIRLAPGDTLLLQARSSFVETHRNNREFYLVSQVGGSSARRHDRALLAGGLFALLIGWLICTTLAGSFFESPPSWLDSKVQPMAALAIVLMMIVSRCLTTSQARSAIDLQVLITIAAAMGLGEALTQSGAADWLANLLVSIGHGFQIPEAALPWLLLTIVYLTTMVLTELITNAAVASMMIPLGIGVAAAAGLNPRPFIMAVAVAASLSFATPIGYQTNLMVLGPGGYHPRDYMRVGGPLTLLVATLAIILLGTLWPLGLIDQ